MMGTECQWTALICLTFIGLTTAEEITNLKIGGKYTCPSSSTFNVNEDKSATMEIYGKTRCTIKFEGSDDISSLNQYKVCVEAEVWEVARCSNRVIYKEDQIFPESKTTSCEASPDKWCSSSGTDMKVTFDIQSRSLIRLKVSGVNTYNQPLTVFYVTCGIGIGGFVIILALIFMFRKRV